MPEQQSYTNIAAISSVAISKLVTHSSLRVRRRRTTKSQDTSVQSLVMQRIKIASSASGGFAMTGYYIVIIESIH